MTRGLGPALTLGQMLDQAAARDPSQEAVVFKGERVSYGLLKARADAFAQGLLALGIAPGDHVVLWMPNRVEWNVANLAIAKAGGVTVTCNSRYKTFEVEYVTYPAEIENFYLRHPKVLDISIVGVPDPLMGEAVMAFVIPKAGETLRAGEVAAFARGKIANFKVPKYVEIVESFPLTGSGKVQKFKQKDYAVKKYGLKEPA